MFTLSSKALETLEVSENFEYTIIPSEDLDDETRETIRSYINRAYDSGYDEAKYRVPESSR